MFKTQLSKHNKDNLKVNHQHFETALKKYRIGRVKPIELVLSKYGDSFTHPLYTKIESRLSHPEWSHLQQTAHVRENALMAVRRGEFGIAERLFAEARTPLKANSLSCEGKLLHETFLEQAQAYLDYRRGNFEQVYIRMFNALRIDLVLEEEYDYEIMVIHRIQLLHNLVRTEACRGDFRRAMEIASTLLGYLSGTLEVLPFSGSWGRERLKSQSEKVLAATFSQITSEIALILAGKETQTINDLLAITLHHLQLSASNKNCLHQRSYQWFRLKQAIANNNPASFLEKTSCFLASGRVDTPFLWYATVVDLVSLCKKFDFPCAELIIREVAQDVPEWKLFPKRLLALIDLK
ncbi:hypothetical protein [Mastigocoleus testarum]|uniref:Uncharacterized protein n=1 Tax=Mastigocoleus testarum BC008 TaxID=371196 RepID=A0A0V7ZFN4_9CYAN|nr:hypothetical protein [Mastigocoleus testarum]KST62923.1 hypothetical protein BC008_11425 [Mastigocoleus testarum BC008]KST63014.1 hypothetical protein BC008_11900 [Mastigocoleus testarum BC008]